MLTVTVLVNLYFLQVWNLDSTSQSAVFSPYKANGDSADPHLGHTPAFPATEEYKVKAKDIIKKMRAGGGKFYVRLSLKMYTSLSKENQDGHSSPGSSVQSKFSTYKTGTLNPLNPELNPICYLLALLGAHHFLHVSRIRVKLLTFRLLMSYIYGAPILDVSRSHTTTQHSR